MMGHFKEIADIDSPALAIGWNSQMSHSFLKTNARHKQKIIDR